MTKKKTGLPIHVPSIHPSYDRSQPRLREVVSVQVVVTNDTYFEVQLTRVPRIGEVLSYGSKENRVLRSIHAPVNHEGRADYVYYAFVVAELVPEPPRVPSQRRKRPRPAEL